MSVPVWQLQVDWSGNSSYGDTGEDVTTRILADKGITWERGRDQLRELAPPMAGTFNATLDNRSRDYSPANSSGPLFGNLVPGRGLRWRATSGGTVPLWQGNLDDLPQHPALGDRSVQVPALGTLAQLKGTLVSSSVYANVPTDYAFNQVCRLAGLTNYTALDGGKTTLTLWWAQRQDAFAALVSILAAEGPGAAIYEDASGFIVFHSRHYRLLTARSTTSQATFRDTATSPFFTALDYQPNLKSVVNSCAIAISAATLGAAATLKTWTGALTIPAGQTRTIWFDLGAPATGLTAAITYTATAVLNSYLVAGPEGVAAGTEMTVQVRITAGTATMLVTDVVLTGQPYTATTETVTNLVDTSASQAKYGVRALPGGFAPWPYIDTNVARDFCDAIVTAYQEPRATATLTVPNADATALGHQLNREISDRVTIVDAQTGLNTPAYIERIKHTVSQAGRLFVTEFGCETTGTQADWFIWDTSTWDVGRWGF